MSDSPSPPGHLGPAGFSPHWIITSITVRTIISGTEWIHTHWGAGWAESEAVWRQPRVFNIIILYWHLLPKKGLSKLSVHCRTYSTTWHLNQAQSKPFSSKISCPTQSTRSTPSKSCFSTRSTMISEQFAWSWTWKKWQPKMNGVPILQLPVWAPTGSKEPMAQVR